MPKLSFVVPIYNVEQQLTRCLDSILTQTYRDFEIIAVDDGSTDKSGEILDRYAEKHSEIRPFHKENGGLSDARNYGLDRAEGEYVSFVDSDDFLSPDYAEKMVGTMEKENLDLVLCDYIYYYDSGKEISAPATRHFAQDPAKDALLAAPMAWLRLYRRSLLNDIRFVKGIYYEDLEMTPKMILKTDRIGFVPEGLYYYYQREGSIMRQAKFNSKFLDIFSVTRSLYTRFQEEGKLEAYRDEIEFLFLEHLYRSAALRFALLPEGKELFRRLRSEVEGLFPHWKKNPYLAKVSLFFRLTVYCTGMGWRSAVALLARMKG